MNETTKIEIIRNGVNLKTLVSNQDFKNKYKISSKFILFVGRFSRSKGIDTLIRAFDLFINYDKVSGLTLVIMGVDFGYEKIMVETIQKSQLSK